MYRAGAEFVLYVGRCLVPSFRNPEFRGPVRTAVAGRSTGFIRSLATPRVAPMPVRTKQMR